MEKVKVVDMGLNPNESQALLEKMKIILKLT
jgi:hypothetical protein